VRTPQPHGNRHGLCGNRQAEAADAPSRISRVATHRRVDAFGKADALRRRDHRGADPNDAACAGNKRSANCRD
jgi:hypothetical protein